jgi:hypothetical protein
MEKFQEYLREIIKDNELEIKKNIDQYTFEEKSYMRGYNQALKDVYNDFNIDWKDFEEEVLSFSTN